MQNAFDIYDERKKEIDFYYEIIVSIEQGMIDISTKDNTRFIKVMKSNLFLMLYNIVEASFISGMKELADKIHQEPITYQNAISEIQKIWTESKITEVYKASSPVSTYHKKVSEIIECILNQEPIKIPPSSFKRGSGNFDADLIKRICDDYRIRCYAKDNNERLDFIKRKRNSLAHGDESFSECSRDISVNELEFIKDESLDFLLKVLNSMKLYYDSCMYKTS